MTLTDAGALVCIIETDEPDYQRCHDLVDQLSLPLVTTWPAFTEAMHILGRRSWNGQDSLWQLVLREDLVILPISWATTQRAAHLMKTYADRPMDLADATLVALAEEHNLKRILTLDKDFYIYRLKGNRSLEVVP